MGRLVTSGWTHAALLGVLALAAWLPAGLGDAPILADRAYFTYLGQAILRGDPIYSQSFMAYPPLGPLASAAAMAVGRAVGLPTYAAPRYLALALGVLDVALVYLLARRATGRAWAGIAAGVALAGFERFGSSNLSTLEPKHLALLFTPLACLALQARRPFAAGLAGTLAAASWQPAGLVALSGLAGVLWSGRRAPLRAAAPWLAGSLAALLPVAIYLTAASSWRDFAQRALVMPAAMELPGAGASALHWLRVLRDQLPGEGALFAMAAAGFTAFAWRGRSAAAWLDPRLGGAPLLTLGWIAWNSFEFGNYPDVLPLLPLVAFWIGWGAERLSARVANRVSPRASAAAALALVAAAAFWNFPPKASRPALSAQERFAARLVRLAGAGPLLAISAEEVYVLSERRAPLPFLRLSPGFVPFLPLVGLADCGAFLERIRALAPAVVALKRWSLSSDCERRLGASLLEQGYRQGVPFPPRRGLDQIHVFERPGDRRSRLQRGSGAIGRPAESRS